MQHPRSARSFVEPAVLEADHQIAVVARSFPLGIGQGNHIADELRFYARIAVIEF